MKIPAYPVFKVCVLLTLATLLAAAGVSAGGSTPLHDDFDRMLRTHVRNERVDYHAWKIHDADALEKYLTGMDSLDPDVIEDKAERLAFEINLYNASMIAMILKNLRPEFSTSDRFYSIFDKKEVRRNGERISLNDLEHKIIRPTFQEPRIHAALVCGAISCPPLLPRAYKGEDLFATLETNMKRFLNDDKRNRVVDGKTKLSKIFKWYGEDFGEAGVLAYARRYRPDFAQGKPGWLPYDWGLNITASTTTPRTDE
jgi:hypothetical protein